MEDSREALRLLLDRVQQIELNAMREKAQAILDRTEPFIEELARNSDDEFLDHIAEIRRRATTFLEQTANGQTLSQLFTNEAFRESYSYMCSLLEFAFVLRSPEDVEQVHAAL